MIDLLDTIFQGLVTIVIPVSVVGLIGLIAYVVYRDVRQNRDDDATDTHPSDDKGTG